MRSFIFNFNFEITPFLSIHNPSLFLSQTDGNTPLHRACMSKYNDDVVKVLLSHPDIDPNIQNRVSFFLFPSHSLSFLITCTEWMDSSSYLLRTWAQILYRFSSQLSKSRQKCKISSKCVFFLFSYPVYSLSLISPPGLFYSSPPCCGKRTNLGSENPPLKL